MKKPSALNKILDLMRDGEIRTLRRVHYLTDISLNTIRRALTDGHLIRVGTEPRPVAWARCGQAIVKIAPHHLESPCPTSSQAIAS